MSLVTSAGTESDFAGKALCRYVEATDSGDDLLWRYIVSAAEGVDPNRSGFVDKLRCGANFPPVPEFLRGRMIRSDELLSLAVASIERWSIRRLDQRQPECGWDAWFLMDRPYGKREAGETLVAAIEGACMDRAGRQSDWWKKNEPQLRQSRAGVLRRIALLAYARYPETHADGICWVLRDESMIESGYLLEELKQLLRTGYQVLGEPDQDWVQERLTQVAGDSKRLSEELVALRRRDLLMSIPAFLRSPQTQRYLVELYRRLPEGEGTQASGFEGGFVRPTASEEELLRLSDEGLVRFLGYLDSNVLRLEQQGRSIEFDSLYSPITQAASRDPERYLRLLRTRRNEIPSRYLESFLTGIANHLLYRFGNLSPSTPWKPLFEPEGAELAAALLGELEYHWCTWKDSPSGFEALKACVYALDPAVHADRAAFLLLRTWIAPGPLNTTNAQEDGDLIIPALNSQRGVAAEATAVLTRRLGEAHVQIPVLLASSLRHFSQDPNESVRALLVHYLPIIQHYLPELGWECFARAVDASTARIWVEAERCLYHGYQKSFHRVAPYLSRIESAIQDGSGATWGRISALAVLSGHVTLQSLFVKLLSLSSPSAWAGAASVFATNAHHREHGELCFAALKQFLDDNHGAEPAAKEFAVIFRPEKATAIPEALLRSYFEVLSRTDARSRADLYRFHEWLRRRVMSSPAEALAGAELAIRYAGEATAQTWDPEVYPPLLTRLFREAEEREGGDSGAFLKRVIAFQDTLLRLGVHRIDEWLRDAERP